MKARIKEKVFQIHGFVIVVIAIFVISLLLGLLALCKAQTLDEYLLCLYIWFGFTGFWVIVYILIVCDAETDYFSEIGIIRKSCKKVRFHLAWSNVRLLKYKRWAGIIPICSIGVPEGTFSEETLKKNIGSLIFSSGVVLCMRKKKFQEIIDLIPEDLKQNMQIEV